LLLLVRFSYGMLSENACVICLSLCDATRPLNPPILWCGLRSRLHLFCLIYINRTIGLAYLIPDLNPCAGLSCASIALIGWKLSMLLVTSLLVKPLFHVVTDLVCWYWSGLTILSGLAGLWWFEGLVKCCLLDFVCLAGLITGLLDLCWFICYEVHFIMLPPFILWIACFVA
jgi:hypothetical protein